MKRLGILSVICVGLGIGIMSSLNGETISKVGDDTWLVHTNDDVLVAHAVLTMPPYSADPSGVKDSTKAFKKAISAVGKMGGGLIYVPAGNYKVLGTIDLNQDKIVIHGESAKNSPDSSTVLLAYHGKGREHAKSFITISGSSCGLRDLAIFYPDQGMARSTRSGPNGFVPFPYTIRSAPSVLLENLTLYNSYNGIHFGLMNAVLLENIRMCALNNGIAGKLSSEFGWARNLEISAGVWQELPGFLAGQTPSVEAIRAFMKENCTGVELGALDGFVLDGLSAEDCNVALWVTKDREFIRDFQRGDEVQRLNDNFGFGGILSRIEGRIAYTGHDFYYWGIPAINLDNVRELPELRSNWPSHKRAARTSQSDFFSVMDFGASGDGKTDDTTAVQEALKQAAANGGGIVYLPQGKYRITSALAIPPGTELRGACARQEVRLGGSEVSSILFDEISSNEKYNTSCAFIVLDDHSGVRGLNILFPEQWQQLTRKGFNPIQTPPAVQGRGKGVYLIDCVITPAWKMIDFSSHACDNFMIKRVAGWGIQEGINIRGGTSGGTVEFTQITFGLALNTANNPLARKRGGIALSRKIMSDYSGRNTVSYRFGDASNLVCYGLQAFHPLNHIEVYAQGNIDDSSYFRDSKFYYPLLDVSLEQSLVMNGARNIDFYGYWVTGRNRDLNWVKARNIENVRVFAPGIQPTYHRGNYEESVPLDAFKLIPEANLPPGAKIVQGDSSARYALDGNPGTYWQAQLDQAEFVVDLGKVMTVHRFTLVDGHMIDFENSTAIKRYRISASLDNEDWQPLEILNSNWQNYQYNNPEKYIVLDQPVHPVKVRYVKLEILNLWEPEKSKGPKESTIDTRSAIVRMFNIWTNPL